MQITLDLLKKALGDKLGCVLTPELAAEITCAAVDRENRALDPQAFPPRAFGRLVFQAESFRDVLAELEPLHAAHFAETERHLDGVRLDPDYGYMAERERTGTLVQFTARSDAGQLVGNLRMYVGTSLHTKHRFAEEDTFYLDPAYRQGHAALALLRYAEDMLVQVVGVVEIRANSKVVNRAHRLMDRRGFRHVANQYIKIFVDQG
jgi:hypothetical protein